MPYTKDERTRYRISISNNSGAPTEYFAILKEPTTTSSADDVSPCVIARTGSVAVGVKATLTLKLPSQAICGSIPPTATSNMVGKDANKIPYGAVLEPFQGIDFLAGDTITLSVDQRLNFATIASATPPPTRQPANGPVQLENQELKFAVPAYPYHAQYCGLATTQDNGEPVTACAWKIHPNQPTKVKLPSPIFGIFVGWDGLQKGTVIDENEIQDICWVDFSDSTFFYIEETPNGKLVVKVPAPSDQED